MGYKNKKKYYKDLHQQAYEVLKKKLAIGESKKQAIQKGTAKDKIFSYKTYKTYWGQIKYFISYVKKNHPECKNLKYARQYVREWLKQGEEQMNTRNEIKAYITREGMTLTEVVEKMAEQYGWSASVPNLSGKLRRGSLRYQEAVELADALGYDVVWQKRKERR